jgi:hypothetical protein
MEHPAASLPLVARRSNALFGNVERVVLNALATQVYRRIFAPSATELASSSEKPIHPLARCRLQAVVDGGDAGSGNTDAAYNKSPPIIDHGYNRSLITWKMRVSAAE